MSLVILKEHLDIISQIKAGDKLNIFYSKLQIDKPSIFRPIYRFFLKQNRLSTHNYILKLIDDVIWEMDNYITSKNIKNPIIFKSKIKNRDEYFEIQNKMEKLKTAVKNLSITYQNDLDYLRMCNLLINRINKVNPEYYSYWIVRRNCNLPTIDEDGNYRESVTF